MIVAKTLKGKGVSFLEDKEGWHGKALKEEDYQKALKELGEVNKKIRGTIQKPDYKKPVVIKSAGENCGHRIQKRRRNPNPQSIR